MLIQEFVEHLRATRLLTPDQLAQVQAAVRQDGHRSSAEALASGLIRSRWLTPWQARELLDGRRQFHVERYRLVAEIGRGSMGIVYQAYHPQIRRRVAIKVLSDTLVVPERAAARFRREVEALGQCEHPNIVQAFDAGIDGTSHFLVMEYVRGRTAAWYSRKHRMLPIGWSCEVIRQAAVGLQHVHALGIIHRDVKPSNLLIARAEDGNPLVKVSDLGLARFCDRPEDALTGSNEVIGTVNYMAPEQGRSRKDVDGRADVYSLAATLYRMLCGRAPFTGGNNLQKLIARFEDDPEPAGLLRPGLPPGLAEVIRQGLARDPEDRIPTAAHLAVALAQFTGWRGPGNHDDVMQEASSLNISCQL